MPNCWMQMHVAALMETGYEDSLSLDEIMEDNSILSQFFDDVAEGRDACERVLNGGNMDTELGPIGEQEGEVGDADEEEEGEDVMKSVMY